MLHSESFYRSVFEHSMEAVFLTAPDGAIFAANPAACKLFGRTEEEICKIGRSGVVDATSPQLGSFIEERARTGKARAELIFIRGDGSRFPGEVSSGKFIGDNGQERTILVVRDLSEQKQAEQKLFESEDQYRLLITAMAEGVTLQDENSAIIAFNKSAERILGLTADQLSGRTSFDPRWYPIHEDGSPFPGETHPVVQTLKTGVPQSDVIMGIHKPDGELIWISINVQPIFKDGMTKPYRVVATMHDITERKRAEESLRVSEQRFHHFFEHEPNYCYLVSPDGSILDLNLAALQILGYSSKDEIVGKPLLSTVYAPSCRDKARQLFVRWKETGELKNEELSIVTKNGEERTIVLNVGAVRDVGGNLLYSLSIQTDITERKQIEIVLTETQTQIQAVINSTDDMIWSVDPVRFGLLTFNQGLKKYFKEGLNVDCRIGMTPEELLPSAFTSQWNAIYTRALREGFFVMEYPASSQSKILMLAVNVMKRGDEVFGISVFAKDITERKQAEQQIAEYVKQLEGTMQNTLQAVANMVEMRDPYTAGHERRVGLVAAAIAREMGWPEDKCHDLQLIGLVHDIGKIAVPAEILTKPGRLTKVEYQIVQAHSEKGYEILKDVDFPLPIAEIIYQHHERMDGSGYPRGLKDGEILPEARILAVADVLESMASHRPYRPALGIDAAIKEIEEHRGTWFDAPVVDAMLKLIREKGYQLPT